MSAENNNGNRDGSGVNLSRTITLTYDTATHQVSIGGESMPISLAQMITGEGLRLLEEQRRTAAALSLQKALRDNAHAQAVADALRGRQ